MLGNFGNLNVMNYFKKVAETMRFELMEGITLRTLSKGVV